jgi:LCP family protein required for cell wall assembly
MRSKRNTGQNQVNLVSARSRSVTEAQKLSRINSADGYAQVRKKRARKKRFVMGATITLASVLIASLVAVAAYAVILSSKFGTDLQGNKVNFDSDLYAGTFTPPAKPEDPFWILLLGTDDREGQDSYEIPRTDTLILARVDQKNNKVALISIPRDLYANLPGYGYDKINAAYTYAELNQGGGGPAGAIAAVKEFAGVNIAYFAQINFSGFEKLVNSLGGVEVDVPVDIVDDLDSGGLDIYSGVQVLDGAHALTFVRCRNVFDAGDYQRQANQRTFLQALAKQVLASDPATIASALTSMADMTLTNMELTKMLNIAQGMRGLEEGDIRTYHVPSEPDTIFDANGNPISYVIADPYAWQELISALDAGEYPPPQEGGYAGVVPDSYAPTASGAGATATQPSDVNPGDYVIDVRNGYGIQGSATSVSDMLVLAGYNRGEIGNTSSFVYDVTLIIYKNETDKAVANDIRKRLGYGKVMASAGNYTFSGNVLIVVGGDFTG